MLRWKTSNTSHHPAIGSTNDGQNPSSRFVFMQAPAHFSNPLPARLATAPACTAAQAATHQRRAARPQTHSLLMTRHPNHPNRPTNDRRTPDQHTIGTQQHVRACTDMQERFQHSHPCKPLGWLQRTTGRPSRHSTGTSKRIAPAVPHVAAASLHICERLCRAPRRFYCESEVI